MYPLPWLTVLIFLGKFYIFLVVKFSRSGSRLTAGDGGMINGNIHQFAVDGMNLKGLDDGVGVTRFGLDRGRISHDFNFADFDIVVVQRVIKFGE